MLDGYVDDGVSPLVVDQQGTSFMVSKLGHEAGPMKQYRELTVNSYEAIQALITQKSAERDYKPQIRIWPDEFYRATEETYKYCHSDNGIGMTKDELEGYFSHLFKTSKVQANDGNYGIGAKVTTAVHNPIGVEIRSWRDGVGYRVIMREAQDPITGLKQYGLHRFERDGHFFESQQIVDDRMKSNIIGDHGTMVILHGTSADEDTTFPEAARSVKGGKFWNIYYLNSTFFDIPLDIHFTTFERQFDGREFQSRVVKGYRNVNDAWKETSGVADITGAKVHWWILRGHDKAARAVIEPKTTPYYPTMATSGSFSGFAALHKGELYQFRQQREAATMLKQCGVIAGWHNVVIYIEPTFAVFPNITRTTLYRADNVELPWTEWAREFSQNLPAPLAEHINRNLPDSMTTVEEFIREQVRKFASSLKVKRSVADKKGTPKAGLVIDATAPSPTRDDVDTDEVTDHVEPGPGPCPNPNPCPSPNPSRERRGRQATRKALFGTQVSKVPVPPLQTVENIVNMVPKVIFEDDIDQSSPIWERAGQFTRASNTLFLNPQFVIMRSHNEYTESLIGQEGKEDARAKNYVDNLVRKYYAAQAALAVVSALVNFQHKKAWSTAHIDDMLKPESISLALSDVRQVRTDLTREIGRNPLTKKYYAATREATNEDEAAC